MTVPADDPLPEAVGLVRRTRAGLPLRLLGGLGVRVVCPGYPPRLRAGQDIDLACLPQGAPRRRRLPGRRGCTPDRRFNNLNGDQQMYFTAPSGRPIDVMVDRLTMCHMLDFRPSFRKLPHTVDVVDLLLSKLQIVELNEKDARDIVQMLSVHADRRRRGARRGHRLGPVLRGARRRTGAGGGPSPATWTSCPHCSLAAPHLHQPGMPVRSGWRRRRGCASSPTRRRRP